MDWFPTLELRRLAHEVTTRLQAEYHADTPHRTTDERLPAVDELVLTVLSQSTNDRNSWRGFEALRARFASWDAVADAPEGAVEEAIRPCGLSRQKAPRIQAMLHRLREEQGTITLDFLADLAPDAARDYLMTFRGVGRKTASCVLLFALDIPCMPVDTHVLRVGQRLGLLPEGIAADPAHDLLEALLPEELYFPFHVNIIAHGRHLCQSQRPRCEACPILDLCPWGRGRGGREWVTG